MSLILKYSKGQYQAKISELESLYAQLEVHLGRMEELKENIFTFWDDKNARIAAATLVDEIRNVRTAMSRTGEMLAFYRSAVEQLGGADAATSALLEEALSILNSLN